MQLRLFSSLPWFASLQRDFLFRAPDASALFIQRKDQDLSDLRIEKDRLAVNEQYRPGTEANKSMQALGGGKIYRGRKAKIFQRGFSGGIK